MPSAGVDGCENGIRSGSRPAHSGGSEAKTLLDEMPFACANIGPHMLSPYDLNGESFEAREVGMLIETDADLLERAVAGIADLHRDGQTAPAGSPGSSRK